MHTGGKGKGQGGRGQGGKGKGKGKGGKNRGAKGKGHHTSGGGWPAPSSDLGWSGSSSESDTGQLQSAVFATGRMSCLKRLR